MTREERINGRIAEIATYYGLEAQLGKTKEELNELMTALEDYEYFLRSGGSNDIKKCAESLIEEMADSRIMINQITFLIGAENRMEEMTDYKTERQVARISKKEQEKENNRGKHISRGELLERLRHDE